MKNKISNEHTPCARDEPDSRLDAGKIVVARRAGNAPVRLRPQRHGRQTDRRRDARAAGGAARVRVGEVRVRRLSAASRPPGGNVATEMRPFGEIGFAWETTCQTYIYGEEKKGSAPRIIAPAARRRLTTPASIGTTDLRSENEPAVVFIPRVNKLLDSESQPKHSYLPTQS